MLHSSSSLTVLREWWGVKKSTSTLYKLNIIMISQKFCVKNRYGPRTMTPTAKPIKQMNCITKNCQYAYRLHTQIPVNSDARAKKGDVAEPID